MKRKTFSILAGFALAFAARGAVDLVVNDFAFQPGQIEPLVNPEQVRFTLGNYGPDSSGDVEMSFILSRNQVIGDADDRLLASQIHNVPLGALEGAYLELPTPGRAELTIPADASGDYYAFIRVSPSGQADLDPSDNTACATNVLSVSPLLASTYAVFANSQLVLSNLSLTPRYAFEYNAYYGNNWRILYPAGGFSCNFAAPTAGKYQLKVRHLTSSDASCPGNGYAPVTIRLNGVPIVKDFDVALAHGGIHGYATDVWTIPAQEGDNTLEWFAGDLCTHYWLQRIEITRPVEFTAVTRLPGGSIQWALTGEPGRTNAIEISTNLADWTPHTNLFNPTGTVQWCESPPAGINRRFYRARVL